MRIGVVGLGYVGLPLAVALARSSTVIAYDCKKSRVTELRGFYDRNGEVSQDELSKVKGNLTVTSNHSGLANCDVFIVTVPTPVLSDLTPDLSFLMAASRDVGINLRSGGIVIYESTVYPGATEELCVPILEDYSGLKFSKDFEVGYSPERMNPGDKTKKLEDIVKVIAASSSEALRTVNNIYSSICKGGIHVAESIKVAEAAKVIENTQRDINIALMNELSIICDKLAIDTNQVLDAAATKWNFNNFRPGLVGGHCIGVDPYYLSYKARSLGINTKVILAGRETNESIPNYVANRMLKNLSERGIKLTEASVMLIGLTFKENCPDLRNSKSKQICQSLLAHGVEVGICDPVALSDEVRGEYPSLQIIDTGDISARNWDGIIFAVSHREIGRLGLEYFLRTEQRRPIIFDLKGIFSTKESDWRL
jgi:UDP-N-acetyl-D-glucosamine/UDP-N-acetyl-D-galactosamine dehydrogenase